MGDASTEAEVLGYLRDESGPLFELAAWARRAVVDADPDLTERVYRGWRGVGFRHPDAGYVCAIHPRGDRVDLLFEHGASLPDPEGVLEGSGTQTRVLRLRKPSDAAAGTIARYVQQAVAQRLLERG